MRYYTNRLFSRRQPLIRDESIEAQARRKAAEERYQQRANEAYDRELREREAARTQGERRG